MSNLLNGLGENEINSLKFSGLDFTKSMDSSSLKIECFEPENNFLIASNIEDLYFSKREHRSIIEIGLFIHQDQTIRCLRIYPGGCLEGGPHCFLVSHSTRGDEEIPVIFKFIQEEEDFIDCSLNKKLMNLGFKKLSELINQEYVFKFKHGIIKKFSIKRAMIVELNNDFFLEISFYLNQGIKYKCLRFKLKANDNGSLISSFGSGKKSYPMEFKIVEPSD